MINLEVVELKDILKMKIKDNIIETPKPQLLLEQFNPYWSEDKKMSCKIVILDFSKYDNKPNIQHLKIK